MIKLNLIEFSDYVRTKEIIDEILKQNPDIKPPIPLDEIARVVGIKDISYKPLDGLEGALVANEYKDEGVILVNNSGGLNTEKRQRFTLGHELGHFMIPHHGYKMSCSIVDMENNSSKMETVELEANDFASKILMPEVLFCRNTFFDNPSIKNIQKLGLDYAVSFEASANRYVTTHHEPLVILFYKDKKLRYFKQNDHLPFYFQFKPCKNAPLPLGSISSQMQTPSEEKIELDYIDPSVWFNQIKGFALPDEIVEEVYIQKNGYSATLLRFDKEIEEIED